MLQRGFGPYRGKRGRGREREGRSAVADDGCRGIESVVREQRSPRSSKDTDPASRVIEEAIRHLLGSHGYVRSADLPGRPLVAGIAHVVRVPPFSRHAGDH